MVTQLAYRIERLRRYRIWQVWWWVAVLCWMASVSRVFAASDLQPLVDAANPGDTITLQPGETYTGAVIDKQNLTIDLNDATIVPGPSGAALTITAADTSLICFAGGLIDGDLDGYPGDPALPSPHPGIVVQVGADNLIIDGCEVRHWLDGVSIAGSVTSFKLVNSYLHENSDAGIHIDTNVMLNGVVTLRGNLFKENGGSGIVHDGLSPLDARFNSWGHMDGAAAGDGVSGSGVVDAGNATFAELFFAPDPTDAGIEERVVEEAEIFDTAIMVDAAELYAVQFAITYDPALLDLVAATPAQFAADGGLCFFTSLIPGEVGGYCYRFNPAPTVNAVAVPVVTLTFVALAQGTAVVDVRTDPLHLSSGAPGGVMVYVNNGGFGPAQGSGLRLITDEDDGRIVIDVPTAVTEIVVVVAENAGNSPWYWLSLAMIMIGVSWWLICRQFSGPATERKIRTHSCPPLRTVATRSAPYRSYTWR